MTDIHSGPGTPDALREQLSLFILDKPRAETVRPSPVVAKTEGPMRRRLLQLLQTDLGFHDQASGYASHNIHAFAAKFPPQLPALFISELTQAGDVVLDPMMGSGTTIVESLLLGRKGIGVDIDPLAVRLCRVKTTPLDVDCLRIVGAQVLSDAYRLLEQNTDVTRELATRFDEKTRQFVDYWFLPATQRELMALVMALQGVSDLPVRQFLELTFSSIIITKSGGVSMARDLAHTRPHKDKTKMPRNALEQFRRRLEANIGGIAELRDGEGTAQVLMGDARALDLPDRSVDLIVTSPPYANAIDYMRAHKFSLVWLGARIQDLSEHRATYIGAERLSGTQYSDLPQGPEHIVQRLTERDEKKARILRKYLAEMKAAIREMYRVLHPDAACIVVIGTSTMRGMNVETHRCLADIAASVGFDVVGMAMRPLDRNRRMMPARFGRKSGSTIEQRMHEEYVLGLLRPSGHEAR